MAFIDGQAVRFEDLPTPIATSAAPVTVFEGIQVQFSEALPASTPPSISDLVDVLVGQESRFSSYTAGYEDGVNFGYGSQREKTMPPIAPGEADVDKRTIGFHLYAIGGQPASGIPGEGQICSPSSSEIQTNRDLAGYLNAAGALSHIGDGEYRYTFAPAEIAPLSGEGNIWLRVKVPGFKTAVFRIPLRIAEPSANEIRDAVLNAARSGFTGTGTIGEGVAIATAMLQGNFYMDTVTNTSNGQTVSRIRCFHTGAAAAAATAGGSSEGEFATFVVTTVYSGPSKVTSHRVVQQ